MKNKMKTTKTTEPAVTSAGKTSDLNVRTIAYLMLIPAFLALLSSLWMAYQTMGTNLLFVASSKGQLYRNYPIFLVIGLILLLAALLLLRANPKPAASAAASEKDTDAPATEATAAEATAAEPAEAPLSDVSADTPAEQNPAPAPVQKEEPAPAQKPDKVFCTNCGEEADADAKFCMKCGTPLAAKDPTP